jgi:hypothetical protein
MEAFLEKCTLTNRIYVPQRNREMFIFGPLDQGDWLVTLGKFVCAVSDFGAHLAKQARLARK